MPSRRSRRCRPTAVPAVRRGRSSAATRSSGCCTRSSTVRTAAAREEDVPEEARERVTGYLRAVLGDGHDEAIAEVLRTIGLAPSDPPAEREEGERAGEGASGRDAWADVL